MSWLNPPIVGSGVLLLVVAGLMACGQDGNTPADGDVVPVVGDSSHLAGTGATPIEISIPSSLTVPPPEITSNPFP
jgi:hypothetical protein